MHVSVSYLPQSLRLPTSYLTRRFPEVAPGGEWHCSGRLLEGDVVAHGLELSDGFGACFFGVEPGEVVRSGVEVGGIGGGHVPDRDEHGALDGDVCCERAAATGDPAVLGCEIGVLGVGYRDRCDAECALQIGISGPGAAGLDLAG